MTSTKKLIRAAAVFYILVAGFGGFAHVYVRGKVHVPGDATATFANVVENANLVRLGVVADVFMAPSWLFLSMALYLLLKPVNKYLGQAMVVLVAIGTAMICLNMVFQHLGVLVATDGSYADSFGAEGANSLVLLLFDLQFHGYIIINVFTGLWLLPLGYLVYHSELFPSILGVGLMIGSGSYIAELLLILLVPEVGEQVDDFVRLPAILAEISTLLYLVVTGFLFPGRYETVVPTSPNENLSSVTRSSPVA